MKEMRVYVLDVSLMGNYTDEEFIEKAENYGSVYTLKGFENAFNNEELSTVVDYIRFIEVEV